MVLSGAAGSTEKPFSFTYSGNFTDNRINGVGTVRLNTSGELNVTSDEATVQAEIVGGGGGGAQAGSGSAEKRAGGGGGGRQSAEVKLSAGKYEVIIGQGGQGGYTSGANVTINGSDGGDTSAFGYTSTRGTGAVARAASFGSQETAGAGGTPNGNAGTAGANATGGAPNGGSATGGSAAANSGGDGYVELTFI